MISENGMKNGNFPEPVLPTGVMGRRSSHASHSFAHPSVDQQPKAYSPPPESRYEKKRETVAARIYRWFLGTDPQTPDKVGADVACPPTEASPLLRNPENAYGICGRAVEEQREEIAPASDIVTWPHEVRTIASGAAPLIVTFLLQYSIDVSSLIAAGRLGKTELGAVSLANMSVQITCFAAFHGFVSSLDTLCAQAYGSGEKHLVGIYCQRMTLFLLLLLIPISILWIFSNYIIILLVTDVEIVRLVALYLRVLIFAIPGFIFFETGKRFLQAQGFFRATTYALLIGAPIHFSLIWLLVWKVNLGFIGAPIAVAITRTLLPVLLVLYVKFYNGSQCWGGFTWRAFANWWIMIRLAVPGMIMVEAEWLVFEIMTIISAQFGTEYLAAQGILITLTTTSFQVPFPMSIAASTRVAFLIGAKRVDDAKIAARVAVVMSCMCTFLNLIIYIGFRFQLPLIFTNDEAVATLVTLSLPIVSIVPFLEGLSAAAHGILRGIGKQSIGGPANLFSYYIVCVPAALYFGFVLDLKIKGLWMGTGMGLLLVSLIEYTYILKTDWRKAVDEAAVRNAAC